MDKKTKIFLLNQSKTFCMFPWIHLYVNPKGDVYPCCTSTQAEPLGSVKTHTLKEIFNNEKTKQLRMDMAKEVPNEMCKMCYESEKYDANSSFRNYSKLEFENRFDEIVPETLNDGTVEPFKMRYLDIRFSNICNFMCRTCGSECSSQWAAEEKKLGRVDWITLHADDKNGKLLEEVLEHIDYVDTVYFAGGEPLITDEHYAILEELIKRDKKNVKLRYNTNCSTIKYKDKDLLKLWKNFKHIDLSCSIDHYGERAELLRKGTDWGVVESNLIKFRNMKNINFSINTVLSAFNYCSISEFYEYMISKKLILPSDMNHYLTLTPNPHYFAATILPPQIKGPANERIRKFIETIPYYKSISDSLENAINFANSSHTWQDNKYEFVSHVYVRDRIRQEDVLAVFPELAPMFLA